MTRVKGEGKGGGQERGGERRRGGEGRGEKRGREGVRFFSCRGTNRSDQMQL